MHANSLRDTEDIVLIYKNIYYILLLIKPLTLNRSGNLITHCFKIIDSKNGGFPFEQNLPSSK